MGYRANREERYTERGRCHAKSTLGEHNFIAVHPLSGSFYSRFSCLKVAFFFPPWKGGVDMHFGECAPVNTHCPPQMLARVLLKPRRRTTPSTPLEKPACCKARARAEKSFILFHQYSRRSDLGERGHPPPLFILTPPPPCSTVERLHEQPSFEPQHRRCSLSSCSKKSSCKFKADLNKVCFAMPLHRREEEVSERAQLPLALCTGRGRGGGEGVSIHLE